MNAETIAKTLGGRKSANGSWICKCPGHDDKIASLSVSDRDGKILIKCHAGCEQKKIWGLIQEINSKINPKLINNKLNPVKLIPKLNAPLKQLKNKIPNYYHDDDGEVVFQSLRLEYSDGTKSFSIFHKKDGKWESGAGNVIPAPFNYPKWKNAKRVFLFEGEKCAIEAEKVLSINSTCTYGGASNWKPVYAKYFKSKEVIIIPDHDNPGMQYARNAMADISKCAESCSIIELPGLKPKQDIFDWIASGGTKEQFDKIIEEGLANALTSIGFGDEFKQTDYISEIQLKNSANQIPFGITFLDDVWGGILPTDLIVITAKSGLGKTQTAMSIAKQVIASGRKVGFFALEAFKHEIGSRMIYTLASEKYLRFRNHAQPFPTFGDWISGDMALVQAMEPYTNEARAEVMSKWAGKLFTYYLDEKFTVEDLEKRFPVISQQVDLIIFDHLHYIGKTSSNQNQVDFLSDAIHRIKNLVNKYEKPILMIAHVRKENSSDLKPIPDSEDIQGSSDVFKNATKVVSMGRPIKGSYNAKDNLQATYFKIPKDRFGTINEWVVAKLSFDRFKQTYLQEYELVKVYKGSDREWKEDPLPTEAIPRWFRRSLIERKLIYEY